MVADNKNSLTVAEYSDLIIKKFLHHAFSNNPVENLTAAADELYVLLRRLMDSAGGKSEDAKAPLKAIRNAIDAIVSTYPETTDSPEVEELFALCRRLNELCDERIASNADPVGAQRVQDHLRYRLTRLITSPTWDAQAELKVRVLKLVFNFMVHENDRLEEEARDVPSLRLGRVRSIGRGSRDLAPKRASKWGDAMDEVGKMPGVKLLPLMKLMLAEGLQGGLRPHQVQPGTPTPAPSGALSEDLLGFNSEVAVAPRNVDHPPVAPSQLSSSPAPSSVAGDDPFAGFSRLEDPGSGQGQFLASATSQGSDQLQTQLQGLTLQQGHPQQQAMASLPYAGLPRAPSPAVSNSSSSAKTRSSGGPLLGVQTPPVQLQTAFQPFPSAQFSGSTAPPPLGYQTPPSTQSGFPHSTPGTTMPPSGLAYHHEAAHGHNQTPPAYNGPSPMAASGVSGGQGSLLRAGSGTTTAVAGLQPGSGGFPPVPAGSGSINFDASSPYLGQPHPFTDTHFQDVGPKLRLPAPPPAAPMRGPAQQQ